MSSFPTFGFNTTAEEVATVFADKIKGRNVIITGTSINGIGFETARVLAKYGANLVIIAGHSDQRLKLSEDALKKEIPSASIRRLTLDLSSLAAVRKAAAEVNAYPEPIHVLIHNAAAPIGPFALSVDNFEIQMATDYIGPFLFTKLIAPKILATKTAGYTPRMVIVASDAHKLPNTHGVDLEFLQKPEASKCETSNLFQQANSANIMFALEVTKRANGELNAYSVHPGMILTNACLTDFAHNLMKQYGLVDAEGKTVDSKMGTWKTIPQGAATTVAAAFDTRFDAIPGAYLIDCIDATAGIAPHTSDSVAAKKLWEVTEKVIGEKFVF